MSKVMTPSEVKSATSGQIEKAVAIYRAMLEKYAFELPSGAVQEVLGQSGLANDQLLTFRRRARTVSEQVVRHFKVDRTKTSLELLQGHGIKLGWHVSSATLATMPMGGPEEGDLVFLLLREGVLVSDIPRLLDGYGLVLDCAAQIQVNVDDPSFMETHPNAIYWGEGSRMDFALSGVRRATTQTGCRRTYGDFWIAGRRK